jgi:signal transduction histidine kinase
VALHVARHVLELALDHVHARGLLERQQGGGLDGAGEDVGKDDVGAAKQLELLRDSLNHTQASLRAALWGLTEEAEGPAALTELFKYAASRMPQWEGVVRFTLRGREREVARQCSGALLLILQEAVGNALRHGHARHVDVVVDFTDTALIFGVQDDGCGFDSNDMPPAGHLGLDSMRKHAEGLGGTLTVTSEPGKGTSLTVRIPL